MITKDHAELINQRLEELVTAMRIFQTDYLIPGSIAHAVFATTLHDSFYALYIAINKGQDNES